MGGIMWLYQAKGLFMICAPDKDVTTNNKRLFISSGPHKNKIKLNFKKIIKKIKKDKKGKILEESLNLSFNLVKVR